MQTRHLSSELLHLRLIQLSPPAEQVEMLPLPRFHSHKHQNAVVTGRVDEDRTDVAFISPVIGEAAALQGDIIGAIGTFLQTDAASVGDFSPRGVSGEVDSGAVSLSEYLQVWWEAQAACN